MKSKGFTLIELLVVIAIIGILASVVLASLNTARAKGADAATKSALGNSRAQAELYYDSQTPNTYASVCASTQFTALRGGITNSSGAAPVCNDVATGWAMQGALKATAGTYWCVDNTGTSTQKSAVLGVATAC